MTFIISYEISPYLSMDFNGPHLHIEPYRYLSIAILEKVWVQAVPLRFESKVGFPTHNNPTIK